MKRFWMLFVLATAIQLSHVMPVAAQTSGSRPIRVGFLPSIPDIDGILDDGLKKLSEYPLEEIGVGPKGNPLISPTYRIGYGTEFLYLFVEISADSLICRDRAYQNGNGFHLALTMPCENNDPTDQFYVLGFSPQPPPGQEWQKKFVWYHDIDLKMTTLERTLLASSATGGKVGIELLLPWSEVYPYHPWLSDGIGFNLCFVKAVGKKEKVEYAALYDRYFQSEQQRRHYVPLEFAMPILPVGIQAYGILTRNHVFQAENMGVRLAVVASHDTTSIVSFRIWSGEGSVIWRKSFDLPVSRIVEVKTIELPTSGLPSGGYQVSWTPQVMQPPHRVGVTILPRTSIADLSARIEVIRNQLRPGSYATAQFQLHDMEKGLGSLKPYNTAVSAHMRIAQLVNIVQAGESGRDLIQEQTGIQRRAYRSSVDRSLQPYSIKIPDPFRWEEKYPLLVFLHGSGEDDQQQLSRSLTPGGFLEVAPKGRGTSTYYTIDHAQVDIREVVDDVMSHYPVDTTRMVLAGFSMGGYGVYRTFLENPARYCGLAVFSGHPNLANRALGGGHPDFLDESTLHVFKNIPMFVYHGARDQNLPLPETESLVRLLRTAGAKVEFYVDENKGHEAPGRDAMERYFEWLRRVTSRP